MSLFRADLAARHGWSAFWIVRVCSTVPAMTEIGTDWRVADGVATAWFDAPSLIEGAAPAGRIVELSAELGNTGRNLQKCRAVADSRPARPRERRAPETRRRPGAPNPDVACAG